MNPAASVIQFNCLSCGTLLTVPVEMAGVTGPCPQCRASITSPRAAQPPVQAFVPAPQYAALGQHDSGGAGHVAALPPQQTMPAPWGQGGASYEASPMPHGMTGAPWVPAASPVHSPASRPVMDRLLQAQPQQQPIPPYQQRGLGQSRRRAPSSRENGRRGAMWMALLMAMSALAGTSWFFRDQLRATWRSYTFKEDDAPPASTVTPPRAPVTPPAPPAGGAASFDPAAAPSIPRAVPVEFPEPNAPAPTLPPTRVMTASPAHPSMPATSGGFVEVEPSPAAGPPVNVANIAPTRATLAPAAPVLVDMTPECQPALGALTKFFQASTWQERLPFVQTPDSMRPVMEQYYAASPDGALHPTHIQLIRHDKAPETGPPHCVFQVAGGGLKQPLPIMVENTGSGWKVDWLTFTEFKDDLLARFLAAPQPEPARFHVLMRRAHYFDDDVPSLDKKTCYQIMPPMPGFTGNVFARKGVSLALELDKHLGWDVSQAAVVVELQWRKEDRYQWVELTGLVQLNWRNGEPTAPNGESSVPKAQPVK